MNKFCVVVKSGNETRTSVFNSINAARVAAKVLAKIGKVYITTIQYGQVIVLE